MENTYLSLLNAYYDIVDDTIPESQEIDENTTIYPKDLMHQKIFNNMRDYKNILENKNKLTPDEYKKKYYEIFKNLLDIIGSDNLRKIYEEKIKRIYQIIGKPFETNLKEFTTENIEEIYNNLYDKLQNDEKQKLLSPESMQVVKVFDKKRYLDLKKEKIYNDIANFIFSKMKKKENNNIIEEAKNEITQNDDEQNNINNEKRPKSGNSSNEEIKKVKHYYKSINQLEGKNEKNTMMDNYSQVNKVGNIVASSINDPVEKKTVSESIQELAKMQSKTTNAILFKDKIKQIVDYIKANIDNIVNNFNNSLDNDQKYNKSDIFVKIQEDVNFRNFIKSILSKVNDEEYNILIETINNNNDINKIEIKNLFSDISVDDINKNIEKLNEEIEQIDEKIKNKQEDIENIKKKCDEEIQKQKYPEKKEFNQLVIIKDKNKEQTKRYKELLDILDKKDKNKPYTNTTLNKYKSIINKIKKNTTDEISKIDVIIEEYNKQKDNFEIKLNELNENKKELIENREKINYILLIDIFKLFDNGRNIGRGFSNDNKAYLLLKYRRPKGKKIISKKYICNLNSTSKNYKEKLAEFIKSKRALIENRGYVIVEETFNNKDIYKYDNDNEYNAAVKSIEESIKGGKLENVENIIPLDDYLKITNKLMKDRTK